MFTTYNNSQIERYLDREEQEEVGTDRCIKLKTIDRQRDSKTERRWRTQVQIDVYSLKQQIDREEEDVGTDRCIQLKTIDRQRGGGCRYRQMYTT